MEPQLPPPPWPEPPEGPPVRQVTRPGGPQEPGREGEPEAPHGGDALLAEARELVGGLEVELAAIGRALERLDAGEYGCCEVCGAAIPEAVLAVDPAAGRCSDHRA